MGRGSPAQWLPGQRRGPPFLLLRRFILLLLRRVLPSFLIRSKSTRRATVFSPAFFAVLVYLAIFDFGNSLSLLSTPLKIRYTRNLRIFVAS